MSPLRARWVRTWALARWQHIAAASNPVELEELAALRAEHAKQQHPFGVLPLVVLTRGRPDEQGADAASLEAAHRKDHAALAALSSRGTLVIAERSAHHVQLDQPDLVTHMISEMLSGTAR